MMSICWYSISRKIIISCLLGLIVKTPPSDLFHFFYFQIDSQKRYTTSSPDPTVITGNGQIWWVKGHPLAYADCSFDRRRNFTSGPRIIREYRGTSVPWSYHMLFMKIYDCALLSGMLATDRCILVARNISGGWTVNMRRYHFHMICHDG